MARGGSDNVGSPESGAASRARVTTRPAGGVYLT
jgi:hypothetical protein